MLRILTLTIGILILSCLGALSSISSWAQSPQGDSVKGDTNPNQEQLLAAADPDSSSTESAASSNESEQNLKKNPAQATALLEQARKKLLTYSSIRAQITEKVEIGPKSFVISGSYLQGLDLKLRLEFQVQGRKSNDKPIGTLLEICDGQVLWTEYNIKETSRVTRRDVKAILQQAELTPQSNSNMFIAELGLGGLPGLLASIQKNMTFESVSERTVNGKTLTVLNGSWNNAFLAQWKGNDPAGTVQLPAYVPDGVRIYLDPQTLFPRRIVYLKKNEQTLESMVTLNFTKVTLNAPIQETEFAYEPPDGVFPADITNQYLNQLSK